MIRKADQLVNMHSTTYPPKKLKQAHINDIRQNHWMKISYFDLSAKAYRMALHPYLINLDSHSCQTITPHPKMRKMPTTTL